MLIGNPMIFHHYPLEDALRLMARFGYRNLEIWPPQFEACKTELLRQQLVEHTSSLGLSLHRLNVADADYFHPALDSPAAANRILTGLKRDIDLARSLGMAQVLTWEGRKPPGASSADVYGSILDRTVAVLSEATRYAAEQEICLSVEVHPFTIGIEPEFLVQLCDRIGEDQFGVTYDCSHFGVGLPEDYAAVIGRLGERITSVHFCDSDKATSELHLPPGEGCLDLAGIVDALERIGYQGDMMLDLWQYPFPEAGTERGLPRLREVMGQLGIAE